jgi:hypothetical protein
MSSIEVSKRPVGRPKKIIEMKEEKDYDLIIAKMRAYIENISYPADMRHNVFMSMTEFGEWNYEQNLNILKIMDNIECSKNNPDLVSQYAKDLKEVGQKVYERGGMSALRANFYIISNWMRDRERICMSVLDYYWTGVGEWNNHQLGLG